MQQSSPMDLRLQFKAVIVSDQAVPCFSLVRLSEQADPRYWGSLRNHCRSWGEAVLSCTQTPDWIHQEKRRRLSDAFSSVAVLAELGLQGSAVVFVKAF